MLRLAGVFALFGQAVSARRPDEATARALIEDIDLRQAARHTVSAD